MKLTKQKIRELIREVRRDRKKDSMILSEMADDPENQTVQTTQKDSFDEIIDILEGRNPSVKTIGIMSGQNPMAKKTSVAQNRSLDYKLKQELSSQGFQYIEIGGMFDNPEDSVLILNPSQEQMHDLSRMFTQYSYVWGQSLPTFTMMQIDYNKERGQMMEPGSKVAREVRYGEDVQNAPNYYSFDPKTGKKFVIPLY